MTANPCIRARRAYWQKMQVWGMNAVPKCMQMQMQHMCIHTKMHTKMIRGVASLAHEAHRRRLGTSSTSDSSSYAATRLHQRQFVTLNTRTSNEAISHDDSTSSSLPTSDFASAAPSESTTSQEDFDYFSSIDGFYSESTQDIIKPKRAKRTYDDDEQEVLSDNEEWEVLDHGARRARDSLGTVLFRKKQAQANYRPRLLEHLPAADYSYTDLLRKMTAFKKVSTGVEREELRYLLDLVRNNHMEKVNRGELPHLMRYASRCNHRPLARDLIQLLVRWSNDEQLFNKGNFQIWTMALGIFASNRSGKAADFIYVWDLLSTVNFPFPRDILQSALECCYHANAYVYVIQLYTYTRKHNGFLSMYHQEMTADAARKLGAWEFGLTLLEPNPTLQSEPSPNVLLSLVDMAVDLNRPDLADMIVGKIQELGAPLTEKLFVSLLKLASDAGDWNLACKYMELAQPCTSILGYPYYHAVLETSILCRIYDEFSTVLTRLEDNFLTPNTDTFRLLFYLSMAAKRYETTKGFLEVIAGREKDSEKSITSLINDYLYFTADMLATMDSSTTEHQSMMEEAKAVFYATLDDPVSRPDALTYYSYFRIIQGNPENRPEFLSLLERAMESKNPAEAGVLPIRPHYPNHLLLHDIKSTRAIRAIIYIYFQVVAETIYLKFVTQKKINAQSIPVPAQLIIHTGVTSTTTPGISRSTSNSHEAEVLTEDSLVEKGLGHIQLNGSATAKSVASQMAFILSHLQHDWKARVYLNDKLPTQILVDFGSVAHIVKSVKVSAIRAVKAAKLAAQQQATLL